MASLLAAAFLVLWWFTDALVAPDERTLLVLRAWRLLMVGTALFSAGVVTLLLRGRRDPRPFLVGACLFACATSFGLFSTVAGPATPWIHAAPTVPLATLGLLVRPLPRVLAVNGLIAACLLGYYGVSPARLGDPFTLNTLIMVATSAVFCTALGHLLYRLGERDFHQRQELLRLATADSLTEVLNRRAFLSAGARELRRARRSGARLSVLMVDLDHFKAINDRFGHAAGDAVLRESARRLRAQLRDHDLIGRIGGEEFAVALPETDLDRALRVAERLRRCLAEAAVEVDGEPIAVTASLGTAEVDLHDDSLERALGRADSALYEAKDAGRDRVGGGLALTAR